MKTLKYIFLLVLSGISLSCTDEIMDEINKNPNNPANVPSRLIITDALNRSVVSVTNGDYAFYASLFVEHHVGIFNQFYNAEIRNDASMIQSTTYNNAWNSSYTAMRDLKDVIDKCSEGGIEDGNYHTLGVAQVMMAYNLAVLTDACGDVPWTEALRPTEYLRPQLDKQQAIYEDVFTLLDAAIANFDKTTTFDPLGAQDVIYGIQTDPQTYWKKLAYGLKARYTMRLSYIDPGKYTYSDVVSFAGQSFADASEQASYTYNGATSYNPYYLLFQQRDMYGASTSLRDNMNAADPRIAKYFVPHPDNADSLAFAPNGEPTQLQGLYGVSSYFSNSVQPTYLMSFHELKFLEAEAKERMSAGTGRAAAEEAIQAAMVAAAIETADITAYIAAIAGESFDAKYIMKEKYIASFIVESLEAYADMRRLNVMGEGDYITLQNPQPTKFPLRFTYGADDVNNNTFVRDAQGDGRFIYTEQVWWAGGDR
ncbi:MULTISPECIES: SusD/RagB family nutrient-binding outer membrane lipoprotein [Flammeovirga]|uniref:SusD/RagB family nutrient-binding outer membrane lipoprotein n=1 Tax=Flammeovirga agarivorans TaxID=2726742 RepID=A0A7X8SQZ7_9BACT|nr:MULTISPECIES: SusD/RagB family nutrient-binding outer membrane lipoprotein [Flammeovirga]NLR94673.1 SusD/RagB family nutrient-binding outer membrane lipoprotein [Flammeovirga agarivorans]